MLGSTKTLVGKRRFPPPRCNITWRGEGIETNNYFKGLVLSVQPDLLGLVTGFGNTNCFSVKIRLIWRQLISMWSHLVIRKLFLNWNHFLKKVNPVTRTKSTLRVSLIFFNLHSKSNQ